MKIKEIDGYDGKYLISDEGVVYTTSRQGSAGGKLKLHLNNNGYLRADLRNGEEHKSKLVHRLVAQAFIPNPENKKCVNHKDGNKRNNCVNNLEWVTHSENMKHAIKTNLCHVPGLSGEQHPNRKLTRDQIEEIKTLFADGIVRSTIAKRYGVSKEQIYNITNNKQWKKGIPNESTS